MCSAHQSRPSSDLAGSAPKHVGPEGDRVYAVQGMTCDHCAASVTEEVGQVSGVIGVEVDLQSGSLSVRGEGFSDEAILEAVNEAGYQVAAA